MPYFLSHCHWSCMCMLWWCTICQVFVRYLVLLSWFVGHIWGAFWDLSWQFYLLQPFSLGEFVGPFQRRGYLLVLCSSNIIRGNWIFLHLWLLVLTSEAEIGRLCKPLPRRSDFLLRLLAGLTVLERWRLCLNLILAYCLTSHAFPSKLVEEVKDPSHRRRSTSANRAMV